LDVLSAGVGASLYLGCPMPGMRRMDTLGRKDVWYVQTGSSDLVTGTYGLGWREDAVEQQDAADKRRAIGALRAPSLSRRLQLILVLCGP
jgi:hypothetical protein